MTFEKGMDFKSIFLPKFTGVAVFDQANEGAQEAATELDAEAPEFQGPTAADSVSGQIEIMTNALDAGRQGRDDLEQRRRSDRAVGEAVRRLGRNGRRVGLADPVG